MEETINTAENTVEVKETISTETAEQTEMMELIEKKGKSYLFSEKIEIKEREGNYYVEGAISTPDLDYGFDIVELTAIKQMVDCINSANIKLGYNHEEIIKTKEGKDISYLTMVPIGRAIKGWMEGNKAYASFLLNTKSKHWEDVKNGIENKFYDAFSIEYYPKVYEYKNKDGKRARSIKSMELVGVALTGRPLNPNALITNFYAKDLSFKPMEEENMESQINEAEMKEFQAYKLEKENNAKKTQNSQLAAEIKAQVESELKAELTKNMPLLGGSQIENNLAPEIKALREAVSLLPERKSTVAANQDERERVINVQKKAIQAVMDSRGEEILGRLWANGPAMVNHKTWDFSGPNNRRIEYKANLLTSTNTTTYTQSAAELNDVYLPLVYNQLNDDTTLFGALPKEDFSQYQKIQFRAITARNSSAGGYLEDATTFTPNVVTREKFEQGFANYAVIMQVSGNLQVSASGKGGIGDIWTQEVSDSTRHLLRKIDVDLLTGVSGSGYDGTTADKLLGLQHLCLNTGNLYGLARGSFTTLQGNYEAMSSANLSLAQMRKMIRTVEINGAQRNNLLWVMPPLQKDKYLGILQAGQVFMSTSARAGFEGVPVFDEVPILSCVNADTDDVFLVDMSATKIGVQLAPVLEPLYLSDYDGRKAFVKLYFNLFSTNPNRNYWASGFSTSL